MKAAIYKLLGHQIHFKVASDIITIMRGKDVPFAGFCDITRKFSELSLPTVMQT